MQEEPEPPVPWWPELVDLVEYVEGEIARRQGRPPRSTDEIRAAIERDWLWRAWGRQKP